MLGAAVNSFSQKSPLMITGTVTEVKPTGQMVLKNHRYEREDTYFEIRLHLTYYNRGEETLIVPTPRFFMFAAQVADQKVLFLDIPSSDAKASLSVNQYDRFKDDKNKSQYLEQLNQEFVLQLAKKEPPTSYFVVIEPGGSYETGTTINVKLGYQLEVRKKAGISGHDLELVIPDYPYFKVQFSSSLRDRNRATEPLREAQHRWRNFGKLLLTSNGDLFLESDVIINKQPD